MKKILFTITLIIFANLLAFVLLGHILDAIFGTGGMMKLISLVASIPVLAIIMYLKSGKLLQELHSIDSRNDTK